MHTYETHTIFCPIKKYVYKISTYREFRLQIVI